MKNISILLIFILPFTFISCGEIEYIDDYESWFGYYSRYEGNTNHAYFNGYNDAEIMAKKLVEAINISKKLYKTSITALIPPIFLDNSTTYMVHDNYSTCPTSNGYREYNSQPIASIPTPDNYTFECFINYFDYCLNDILDIDRRYIVVNYTNTASKQKILTNYRATGESKRIRYELEAKDINININEGTVSDNMTIFGLIIKDAIYTTDNITTEDSMTHKTITLKLDMPRQETQYRFDFYSDNGTLKFYHYKYGYVTANILNFLNSTGSIDERAKITMVYQENRTCTFSQEEFGNSKWFNCDDYPNYPN